MLASIATAILVVAGIALVAGLLLGFASLKLPGDSEGLVAEIDALLPQTQCAQCGFPGCRPYAEAIANASPRTMIGGTSVAAKLSASRSE